MTDRELERKLEQALDHAGPDDVESILSRCRAGKGTVVEMEDMITDGTVKNNAGESGNGNGNGGNNSSGSNGSGNNDSKNNGRKRRTWSLAAAAAVLALILAGSGGGIFYWQMRAVASIISLDVNPSIELRLNRNGTVLSCKAMNRDAAAVLYEMGGGADLEGIKLDVAVNAIVGALLRHGYLDSISSAILISVEDSDQGRAARIQEELVTVVDTALQMSSSQSAVYSQKLTVDAGMEIQAQNNNISSGKAYMVNQVIALNSSLEFEALAALSVEELRDLIKIGAPGMPIGTGAAAIIAEEYAGTNVMDSNVVRDVDPELDDPVPHYEVELNLLSGEEFEYRIDAFTGAVLSGQQDILNALQEPGNGVGTGSQAQEPGNGGNTGSQVQEPGNGVGTGSQVQEPGNGGDIGADGAKAAALTHAGLSESQVSHLEVERDWDDGRLEYEVEFKCGGYEYEYTISGTSGAVLDHEMEWDD